MKFVTVTEVSNFISTPEITSFHSAMFNGLAERDGKEFPHDAVVRADTENVSPLNVSHTICNVANIFCPGRHLVLSQSIADRLSFVQNIRLRPIRFKRLVDIDWQKGDLSFFETWNNPDPRRLLRMQPDVKDYHERIGNYFELHTYRLSDVVERFGSTQEIAIETGTPPLEKTELIRLSPALLDEFPIIWWSSLIFREDVFHLVDQELDRDFFIVREYELR
jgi:hypothetical protein